MADVYKGTSFVLEDSYRYGQNKVVIVLHSVINDCIKTSLVQHILISIKYTQIIYKKNYFFFLTVYKNERKEHKF